MRTPPTRTRKTAVKARKMWQRKLSASGILVQPERISGDAKPVFVLPADAASYDRMREQVAQELYESSPSILHCPFDVASIPAKNRWRKIADRALSAIGIARPAK